MWDSEQRLVAQISAPWSGTSFRATDADGQVLCAGSTSRLGLTRRWQASGADGGALLSMRTSLLRANAQVSLARGGSLLVRGSSWKRDFLVLNSDGERLSVLNR